MRNKMPIDATILWEFEGQEDWLTRARVDSFEDFERRWMPGCEALGLRIIPMFYSAGFTVGKNVEKANGVLDDVLNELEQLKAWIISSNLSVEDIEYMKSTIDNLSNYLKQMIEKGNNVLIGC